MSDSKKTEPSEDSRNPFIVDSSFNVTKENLWKDDYANRKPFAEMVTKIISGIRLDSSAVLLLDGEWGSGKTFFLQSFRQHLENGKYRAIYFDAFAEDFSADPLLAICGQLWKELSADVSNLDNQKIIKELENVLHDIVNMFVKKEKLQNINTLDLGILTQYAESRKGLEVLKKRLSSAVERDNKPLVFIIDELDRCRPTFALELLERVKHLFQVPGIIFVFGANKESLMTSVRSEYGKQKDEYLQKFFDLEMKLPNAQAFLLAKKYVDKLDYETSSRDFGGGELKNIKDVDSVIDYLYYPLMSMMGVTFREAEISMRIFLLYLSVLGDRGRFHKIGAASCLNLLRLKHFDLYADIAYKEGKCIDVIRKVSPMFDKWDNPNCQEGLIYARHFGVHSHGEVSQGCRLFFNRSICILAEGDEKQEIIRRDSGSDFGISNSGQWEWVQDNLLNRSEIIQAMENLGCS